MLLMWYMDLHHDMKINRKYLDSIYCSRWFCICSGSTHIGFTLHIISCPFCLKVITYFPQAIKCFVIFNWPNNPVLKAIYNMYYFLVVLDKSYQQSHTLWRQSKSYNTSLFTYFNTFETILTDQPMIFGIC